MSISGASDTKAEGHCCAKCIYLPVSTPIAENL